jgi:hypothetical protein
MEVEVEVVMLGASALWKRRSHRRTDLGDEGVDLSKGDVFAFENLHKVIVLALASAQSKIVPCEYILREVHLRRKTRWCS